MEEREVIERAGNGVGTIADLETLLYKMKAKGATHYEAHICNQKNYSYIQFVEYYRVKTEKEVLQDEKFDLEGRLAKLNKAIKNL